MRRRRWARVGAAFVLAAVLAVAGVVGTSQTALAACSLMRGDNGNWHNGGWQNVTSVRGVRADLEPYNPDPVFWGSSLWVMLTNSDGSRYAQVGWLRWWNTSNNYIFLAFTDDSGLEKVYGYYIPGGYWTQYPASAATSWANYRVEYTPGSPGTFTHYWDGGNGYSVSYQWVPSQIQASGEVGNWATGNKGDHSPGDTSNYAFVDMVKYTQDGSNWPVASLSRLDDYNADMGITWWSGYSFSIWDTRCSS